MWWPTITLVSRARKPQWWRRKLHLNSNVKGNKTHLNYRLLVSILRRSQKKNLCILWYLGCLSLYLNILIKIRNVILINKAYSFCFKILLVLIQVLLTNAPWASQVRCYVSVFTAVLVYSLRLPTVRSRHPPCVSSAEASTLRNWPHSLGVCGIHCSSFLGHLLVQPTRHVALLQRVSTLILRYPVFI